MAPFGPMLIAPLCPIVPRKKGFLLFLPEFHDSAGKENKREKKALLTSLNSWSKGKSFKRFFKRFNFNVSSFFNFFVN